MALPDLRGAASAPGFVLTAWSSLTDPFVAEALLPAFDAVLLDMQHGLHDAASVREIVARAALMNKPAIVRVPIGDLATAARCLDFGASGIVLPMVEGAADAFAFASALKYPHVGIRSFGPTRAADLHRYESGRAYFADANAATMAIAMIETPTAFASLDEILAIEHLDGVFVGPSDLSLSLSGDGTLDPTGPRAEAAVQRIGEAAKAAGKIAAIYAGTPDDARRYRGYGYGIVGIASDVGLLKTAAASLTAAARL